jgi:hypothetical protein
VKLSNLVIENRAVLFAITQLPNFPITQLQEAQDGKRQKGW